MDIKRIEKEELFFGNLKFSLTFENKSTVPNGCKYTFKPTIKLPKNELEKAINNNSNLSQYLRETFLLGVSFVESNQVKFMELKTAKESS